MLDRAPHAPVALFSPSPPRVPQVVQPAVKDAALAYVDSLSTRRQELQAAVAALVRCRRARAAMSHDQLLNVDGLLVAAPRGAGVGAGAGAGAGEDDAASVWTDGAYVAGRLS